MLGGGTGGLTLMRVGILTKKCLDARETRVLALAPFFCGEGLLLTLGKVRWEKESLRLALRPAAVRTVRVESGDSGGVRRLFNALMAIGDVKCADLTAVMAEAFVALEVILELFEDDVVGTLFAVASMLLLWKSEGDRMLAILHAMVDMFLGKLIRSSIMMRWRSSSLVVY
jgi:hypothetical protein